MKRLKFCGAVISVVAVWIPLAAACQTTPAVRAVYPQASGAFALAEKYPLLRDVLLDKEFFSRMEDESSSARRDLFDKLEDRQYRTVGSTAPVRERFIPGTMREYPTVILEYQTAFDYFAELPSGGGGRDAMMQRTLEGGSDDPQAMVELQALLDKNKKTKSNERSKLKPEFNALAKKYIPEKDLAQVRAEVQGILDDLAKAFEPYGARVPDAPPGHYGVKIADHLYAYVRDFPLSPEETGNGLRHPHDAFFWLMLSGGPKELPQGFLPAFPGAEGFGAMATGGRGGKVVCVTNTNTEGPGSLAEALNTAGPRIVVFKVSGTIVLPDEYWIVEPDMTIVGHTAPGQGVEIQGRLNVAASNLVFRYLRFRLRPPLSGDSLNTRGSLSDILFDHCSFAYDSDENLRFIGDRSTFANYTIQYCILGPGLAGLHSHPYGPETGGCGSIHHNVFIDTLSRSPESDGYFCDLRNNVFYNCRSGHARRPWTYFNFVENLAIDNPEVPYSYSFNCTPNVFTAGNLRASDGGVVAFDVARSDYLKKPYSAMPVTTCDPNELESRLAPIAGAILPVRDATDAWAIEGMKTRKGKIPYYDNPKKEWENDERKKRMSFEKNPTTYVMWNPEESAPVKAGATPPADLDDDAMPDDWEKAHNLDPADPRDASADADGDGYTNVEEWINATDPAVKVDYRRPENNVDSLGKSRETKR